MNFIRDKMVTKKVNQTNLEDEVLNKGLIHIFTHELLNKNDGEILERYDLLGQPLLLVSMKGKRSMVALNTLYDTPKYAEDKDIEKYYHEEIKLIAGINKALPYIAHFKVDSKVNKTELTDEQCRTCITFKGMVPVK
jgi:hypothetical protein